MNSEQLIVENFYFAPKYFTADYLAVLKKELAMARMRQNAEDYVSLCCGISLIIGTMTLISVYFSAILAIPLFLIVTASAFLIISKYPKIRKVSAGKSIERKLRFSLRYFALQLSISVPFEKALEVMSKGDSLLSDDMKKVLRDVKNGKSIPEALNSFSCRTHSKAVKKLTGAMAMSYCSGDNGRIIKKILDEQNGLHRIRVREYNARMMMYSLAFIGFGAVAPALFQAIFTIGSVFFETGLSPLACFVIIVFVFPLIDSLILWWMIWSRP